MLTTSFGVAGPDAFDSALELLACEPAVGCERAREIADRTRASMREGSISEVSNFLGAAFMVSNKFKKEFVWFDGLSSLFFDR